MDASACSQHLDDKLEPLRSRGIEPVLLSSKCGGKYKNMIHETAFSLAPTGLRVELRHFLRRHIARRPVLRIVESLLFLPLLPFYLLEKLAIRRENEWSWHIPARYKGLSMVKKYRPDLIYSTGGPVSAHLAASYIASKTGLPWIADLQDPLVHDHENKKSARATRYYKQLEQHIRRHADAIIFTTDAHRLNSNRRTGQSHKGHTIYPGADRDVMPDVAYVPGKHCRFAHFGSMGGTRNVAILLPAIESVIQRHPEYRDVIRLDLYGNCDRISRDLIASGRYPEIATFPGKVSRETALQAMMSSDCLLIIQNTEHFATETFPCKVYEYFFTGRPILAMVYNNPEFEQLLGCSVSFIAPADDAGKVADAVENIVAAHLAGEFTDMKPCYQWTSANAVDRLCTIATPLLPAADR
jgi:glycosyltransferase involved in cell wall biosynthesis